MKSKSPLTRLLTSGVSKGIWTAAPALAVRVVPVGLRYQVSAGRGRIGKEGPVGPVYPVDPVSPVDPVYPVDPVGPVGPLTFDSCV